MIVSLVVVLLKEILILLLIPSAVNNMLVFTTLAEFDESILSFLFLKTLIFLLSLEPILREAGVY
ncbi:Uncharacterised protein [Chlamydia trachomatis]|nr:Uncharacterised protein [Chlamydia trachomatis]